MSTHRLLTRTRCAILGVILDQPSWGLRVCRETGLSASSVYTGLQALEKAGFIAGEWEQAAPADRPARRVYQITNVGRVELAAWRATVPPARAAWIAPGPHPAAGFSRTALGQAR
jgi:PadR family transcriptional regulator PadR